MKKTILQIFLASASVFLMLFSTVAHAANRYWVGTGNSSTMWENTANWSTLLKGAGGASVPGASDVAIIRGTGGTVRMRSNVSVLGLAIHPTWTGSVIVGTGTLTVGTTGIRVGSGRLIAQGGTVKNAGSLTQTGGIVTIKNLSLSGSLSIINRNPTIATFTSTGVIILNGASADQNFIQRGNISTTFTDLTVRNTAGTTNDDIIVSGSGLTILGTLTVTRGHLIVGANTLDLAGNLVIANHAQAGMTASGTLTVAGNITKSVLGTLALTGSTLTLDGTNQTLSGSITYNNLRKLPTVARTLTFAAGTTHRAVGTLTLKIIANGGGSNVMSLVSSQPGTTWTVASSTYDIAWLSVQDSAPSGAITCLTCTDAGNNSGWTFRATTTDTTTAATSTGGGGGGGTRKANTTQAAINASDRITNDAGAAQESNLPEVRQKLLVSIDGKNVVLTDTPANAWFAPYVYVLVRDGVVSGYRDARGKPTGEYGPANHVTYGEIAKMAAEAAGVSVKSSAPKNRSAKGHWSSGYVSALEELGVSVFNSSNLNVNDKAPRGAVVQILLEAFAVQMQNAVGGEYSDVPSSGEYANAIETATEAEIVSGDDNATTFRPNAPVNRAEVAKIVSKTIDKYK